MSEFPLEDHIPVPTPTANSGLRGRPAKYPFYTMKIGQSFHVPGKTSANFGPTVDYAKKQTGFKFTTRTVDGGVRIWRTA